jgi:hypothetical protein
MAAPFVQGQLKQEYLSVLIETKCVHCQQTLHIDLDSDMKFSVREREANPLVFMPDVDWNTFAEPNITRAY